MQHLGYVISGDRRHQLYGPAWTPFCGRRPDLSSWEVMGPFRTEVEAYMKCGTMVRLERGRAKTLCGPDRYQQ